MKIPLWAKSKEGKWVRFPYEHLRTFPDGRRGFSQIGSEAVHWLGFQMMTGRSLLDFFDVEPAYIHALFPSVYYYILKEDAE